MMPEGDTIYRSAARLHLVLSKRQVKSVDRVHHSIHQERAVELTGHTVQRVESRGKHLLIHFDHRVCLHSHMGMDGAWHLYQSNQAWRKPEHTARFAFTLASSSGEPETRPAEPEFDGDLLQARNVVAVCFLPKQFEILTTRELRRHRWLSRLGPDILSPDFDVEKAILRFRVHDPTAVGEAVLNQTLVAGIGNVYKSECLFIQRISPAQPVKSLTDDQIRKLLLDCRRLMLRHSLGEGANVPLTRRQTKRRTRAGIDGGRLWVYGRDGEPCYQCGTPVQRIRQGDLARSTYYCEECQPPT